MKEKIIQSLAATISALNCVTVSGKSNLSNLGGSIAMLEEIGEMLSNAKFAEATVAEHAEK